MEFVALGLGLIAVLMAWSAKRSNKELRERIAQSNSRLYNLRRELQEMMDQAAQERLSLKFEILRLQGNLKVTPEMKVGEIMAVHPQAQQVLAAFHLGGCGSCAIDEGQSLAEAVTVNGRELEPVLVALNTLVAGADKAANGTIAAEEFKMPNVQLHF